MTLHSNAVERRAFFYLFTTLWIQLDSSSVIHKLPSSSWIPGLWAYTHFMNAKFLSLSQGNPIEHAQNPVRLDSEPVNPDSEPVSLDSKPVSPDSESVLLDCESKHGWAYTREYRGVIYKNEYLREYILASTDSPKVSQKKRIHKSNPGSPAHAHGLPWLGLAS